MGEKLIVGPINKGLKTNVTPFNIDNDSFPTLINAYQWRGRVKRKRGTSLLTRLTRYFDSLNPSYGSTTTITLSGSGAGNILTGFGLQTNGNIVPGSVTITAPGPTLYTDPAMNGTLSPSGTINYSTGAIVILAQAGSAVSVVFSYYPDLPVMGLEDFEINSTQFPGTIGFDTKYSYNIVTAFSYPSYDVSFYKNPPTGTPATYVQKTNETPTSWNGQDYQQFWTTNFQGSLWATNGITVPFNITNIGMQYKPIVAVTVLTPTTANLQITAHGLVVGDFVFVNEVVTTTGINYQTGYVTTVTDANNVIVTFPNATLTTNGTGGIAQYLTNRSDITKDCLRFYDGDPTDGNSSSPTLNGNKGWVNFAPPLSLQIFSISETPAKVYYLVGARMILPYKDRLLFFGPVIQTSAAGSQIYLQDTVIYSQNGTPYYTVSYTNTPSSTVDTPTSPTNIYTSLLVPTNQTATPSSWIEDQTGFGGFQQAGVDEPMITVATNGDVLICGFDTTQARLVYTGNDILPFNFFLIDSELGSSSTFSVINMGRSVITRGSRGYINTNQERADRIDLEIPDEVFEIRLTDNGTERMCSERDFINEWIYFTYTSNQDTYKFPNITLQYNYRDDSWAQFNEAYTHYGKFRKQSGFTWQTVGLVYKSWNVWNVPWNAGSSTLLQPEVIAGNQQGFVMVRDDGTGEGTSLYIRDITNGIVTSPDHNLVNGDYIIISGVLGTVGDFVNNEIFSVENSTTTTFLLNPLPESGTYFGGGLITKIYVPNIQTKQFPVSWGMGRKTRLGVQQYLLTTTDRSQIQLLIFLSQNSASAYNTGNIVPQPNTVNNSLIYSTTLFTCPESTNLGLTPSNINLNMVTAIQQSQIWHRINTSLLGDTIQLGFTMSDTQVRDLETSGTAFPITGASTATRCVLDCVGAFPVGTIVLINGVVGMTQLNGNFYQVIASTPTQITIGVNSTGFTPYVSGGTATPESAINAFAEIELHGFILDVTPSMVLS